MISFPELAARAGASTRTRGVSITQTALELGDQSPSAFTTMFTRPLGMPSGHLLKTLR